MLLSKEHRLSSNDFDGEYVINVEKGSVLVYSFLGMKTQEIVRSSVINVVLAEDAASLDEVVITAYGNKTTLEKIQQQLLLFQLKQLKTELTLLYYKIYKVKYLD